MGASVTPEKPAPEQLLEPSALQRGVAAAKAAVASGATPATLQEPVIGEQPIELVIEDRPAEKPATAPGNAPETPVAAEEPAPDEPAADDATEAAAEPIVVTLPVLRQGQEPLELECDEQEVADQIRSLIKGNLRSEVFHRAEEDLQAQREEMAQVEDQLTFDPVNFIVERVRPELQAKVALHLLSQPGIYEEVARQFAGDGDETPDREKIALRLERDRLKTRDETKGEIEARAYARRQGRELARAVDRMVPEDAGEDDAIALRDDLLRDIRDYVEQNNIGSLRPEELPHILERRLRQYGVEPADALAALSADAPAPVRPRTPGRPAASGAPDAASAQSTGQKFKQAVEARKSAAAVPGSGAGAPPTRIALPAGQKIEDRVASLRTLFGLRKR